MVGLFSLLDVILEMPLEDLMAQIAVSQEVIMAAAPKRRAVSVRLSRYAL
jgi:c-di-GMP-related signal transduction protein